MNFMEKFHLDEERKECDLQFLPTEQLLKVAEEVLKRRESAYKRLAK